MLKFYSLYSGSSGNSLLVKTENTNILVDAGVSSKKIETALTNLEIDPSSLDGILITHEHSDHVQGLGTFSKKFGIPVFVNQKTLDAMPKQKEKISYFSLRDNGFKCSTCGKQDKSCLQMSESTQNAIKYIVMAPPKKLFSFNLKDESLNELKLITKLYFNEKLEKG